MQVLGVHFAPLTVPLDRRLQTLAAGAWFVFFAFCPFIFFFTTVYLLLFTRYSYLVLMYVNWLFYDRKCAHQGGRRLESVRNWTWWQYFNAYFPLRMHKTSELPPDKNYLLCAYPHGMLATGAFGSFATNHSEFATLYPGLTSHLLTINAAFNVPVFRDVILALGLCAASKESMVHLLSDASTPKAVVLMVGGASEAFNCQPRTNKILLKNRKGFVKVALQTGTPLVPVFSFNETDLFDQVPSPPGSWLRTIQDAWRRILGFAPCIPLGRGLLQYTFGVVPRRHPVTTVVGRPIEVTKTDCPSNEVIDEIHHQFTTALIALFEEYKHMFEKDPENAILIIE